MISKILNKINSMQIIFKKENTKRKKDDFEYENINNDILKKYEKRKDIKKDTFKNILDEKNNSKICFEKNEYGKYINGRYDFLKEKEDVNLEKGKNIKNNVSNITKKSIYSLLKQRDLKRNMLLENIMQMQKIQEEKNDFEDQKLKLDGEKINCKIKKEDKKYFYDENGLKNNLENNHDKLKIEEKIKEQINLKNEDENIYDENKINEKFKYETLILKNWGFSKSDLEKYNRTLFFKNDAVLKNNIRKNIHKFLYILLLAFIYLLIFSKVAFASTEIQLVTKISNAFNRIQQYMVIIATPAAGVAICTGLLMRKFSFGDEERVRTAKRLIRGSMFAYALILCTKFILDFISGILR